MEFSKLISQTEITPGQKITFPCQMIEVTLGQHSSYDDGDTYTFEFHVLAEDKFEAVNMLKKYIQS